MGVTETKFLNYIVNLKIFYKGRETEEKFGAIASAFVSGFLP